MPPILEFIEEDHSYFYNGKRVPSVTTIIGFVAGDPFSRVPPKVLEAARERGKYLHECIHAINDDDFVFDSVLAEYKPWVQSYLDWFRTSGYKPIHNEHRVYHEQFGYAGTLDTAGDLLGKRVIIDVKSGIHDERRFGMQTAGYALAYDPSAMRYALQLIPNGSARLYHHKEPRDFIAWKQAVNLYQWLNRT